MINENFTLFVKINTLKSLEMFEGDDTPWMFEGVASTADIDLVGDVVYPESFSKSVDFFKEKGKIFFDHDYAKKNSEWLEKFGFTKDEILSLKTPIGKPTHAEITPEGLYIKAILNKQHPMARKMWEEFLNNPDDTFKSEIGLSIGARYLGEPRRKYDLNKGRMVTILPDLLLYEVSMTPKPVNPNTWTSVIKSLVDSIEVEDSNINNVQFHHITPDVVLYDDTRDRLVVKSTVTSDDGTKHIFESHINLKEDVQSVMGEQQKVVLKAADEKDENKNPENDSANNDSQTSTDKPDASEGNSESTDTSDKTQTEGAEVESTTEGGSQEQQPSETTEETPGQEAGGEGLPTEGAEMSSEGAMPGAEGSEAGGVLDSLVEGAETQEGAAGGESESLSLIMDKLDTIIDYLVGQGDERSQATMGEVPGEGQVSTEAPATIKSVEPVVTQLSEFNLDDVVSQAVTKALQSSETNISISKESLESFANTLKSVIDGIEDRVVGKVLSKIAVEQTTMKSVSRDDLKVLNPGVHVDSQVTTEKTDVIKSIETGNTVKESDKEQEGDVVLKGLLDDFISIVGSSPVHAQQRAKIKLKAFELLGMNKFEFSNAVSSYEKSKKIKQ